MLFDAGEQFILATRLAFTASSENLAGAWTGNQTDQLVANELKHWLQQRAWREMQEIAAHFPKRFVGDGVRSTVNELAGML